MIEAKKGNERWRDWIEANMALFAGLSSSAQIGFLVKEIFENQEGSALIFRPNQAELPLLEEVEFTGLRKLPVDIIFVASNAVLEGLAGVDSSPNDNLFFQLIRRRQVLFFTLVAASDFEDKKYTDFLESIGLGYLGTCVG